MNFPTAGSIFGGCVLGAVMVLILGFWFRKGMENYLDKKRRLIKCAQKLPGPAAIPLIGNALQLRNPDNILDVLMGMKGELSASTFRLWVGPHLKIVITDPRDFEIIMNSSGAAEKDDLMYNAMKPAVVDSLMNGSGAVYRAHKKLVMPFINGTTSLKHYTKIFNKQSMILVETLKKKYNIGRNLNVTHYLAPCISDIVHETLFGVRGGAQSGKDTVMMDASELTLPIIWRNAVCVWLQSEFILKMTKYGEPFHDGINSVHSYIDNIIRMKKKRISDNCREENASILDQLLENLSRTNAWTAEELRYEMLTLFIGSYDTITGISSFTLLMLAMHPRVQEKVRQEIQQVLVIDDVEDGDVANLNYLEMVLRETLRLFPVLPILARKITRDVKISTCTLPEGCSALMFAFATSRDPKYWTEADKFIPERFLPEYSKDRHPYTAVPFSGGLRSCPGSKYGLGCLKVLITHIIRNFNLSTSMRMEDIKFHIYTYSRDANETSIIFERRISG